jgi:hypothetical protein
MSDLTNEYMRVLTSWLADCGDYENQYAKCVCYPKTGEFVAGEYYMEPYDSLYDRFVVFEIALEDEIRRRAEDTWREIVEFTESIDMQDERARNMYGIYVKEVARLKSDIERYDSVNYSSLLQTLFLAIEREKKSAANAI